jgi:hypothetical protein
MSRTWLNFIILAIAIMLLTSGYEIYKSVTGGNVSFNKTVTQIPGTLNEDVLDAFYKSNDKIIIQTDNLTITK